MKRIATSIIFVLAIAGCVGQTTGTTQIDIADVMVTENQPIIPSQPTAGGTFTFRALVKNQHGSEFAENVEVELFDSGKCLPTAVNDDKSRGGKVPVTLLEPTKFAPGQQELIKVDFDAPTSDQIVGLSAVCPIRYKASYNFDAKTEMGIDVASTDRLKQIETETGQRPAGESRTNIGPGPLRILMTPKTVLPAETGKKFQFEISVKNDGNGNAPEGTIEKGKWKITIPSDFTPDPSVGGLSQEGSGTFCNDKFVQYRDGYANTAPIQFVQGQTNAITCYLVAPGEDKVPVEKLYTFSSNIDDYTYEYFGQQVDVTIKP